MCRLFGADGLQGIALTELTCELAVQTGRAVVNALTNKSGSRMKILVGKDTRISSDTLEAALCAGICSAGADAELLGTVPISAVSYLTAKYRADAGIMISPSHNNAEYNGFKIFSSTGRKLGYETEEKIEELLAEDADIEPVSRPGRIIRNDSALDDYKEHIRSAVETDLSGIKIALDCSNGCASVTAAEIFGRLGAEVLLLSSEPDGVNINKGCGIAHMETLMSFVSENSCDCGIAFDGDGDRCLAVDENGELVDSDKLIAIFAKYYKEQGRLKDNTAVVSVMTNLGFHGFARDNSIKTVTASDEYVLEKMLDCGYNLGGSQNGNIFFLDNAVSGDGQLTGVKLLEILKNSGKKMSELSDIMEKLPQVMMNVRISDKDKEMWKNDGEITGLIEKHMKALGDSGRIFVRESGSEPMIRIMIEGKEFNKINAMAMEIARKIKERCALRD